MSELHRIIEEMINGTWTLKPGFNMDDVDFSRVRDDRIPLSPAKIELPGQETR